jgi:predicted nucleotidyltransferase
MKAKYDNLNMVIHVARKLGALLERVVFLGGSATGLLITDPAVPDVRMTQDVDVIVEAATWLEYHRLEQALIEKGFDRDTSEGAPLCRWLVDGVIVDVMPVSEEILGFSNRWYGPALQNSVTREVAPDLTIRLVTAPYFLATKIEAFRGRGNGDYLASHDLEDMITLIDGRKELLDEINTTSPDLRGFLADTFRDYLANPLFVECISGNLLPDKASQGRLPLIMKRMNRIAENLNEESA